MTWSIPTTISHFLWYQSYNFSILKQELACNNEKVVQLAKLSLQRHIKLVGYCIDKDNRRRIQLQNVLRVTEPINRGIYIND